LCNGAADQRTLSEPAGLFFAFWKFLERSVDFRALNLFIDT